jgi:hypothetical protein
MDIDQNYALNPASESKTGVVSGEGKEEGIS